nr:RNA-directed DNA polymerase, eukaryota, reverse transcriptase zinc-binding domain protein [Tanacetum cinerariifolium]
MKWILFFERGKSKKASHPPKLVPSDNSKLELLRIDLCGPMRVTLINGKKHHATIFNCSYALANEAVERHNRTLVEAAQTMLIFSRLPEFLWAKAVDTACFTQNRSITHTRYNKTPYELLCYRMPNVEYFHVFGSLCYPTNDRDDLGKMKPKADIEVFIEPKLQRFNNHNLSAEPMNTPSKEDLDNLFGLMFEEYFRKKSSDTLINSIAQPTQLHEDLPSTSLINIKEHEAPPIETTSDEQTSPIFLTKANELHQEDSVDLMAIHNQVIGDPSKPVMTHQRLHKDSEEIVPRPEGKNIITLKWLWKNKCDAKNIMVRNKKCLVTKGYRQEEGIDFEESFTPVARPKVWLKVRLLSCMDGISPRLADILAFIIPISKGRSFPSIIARLVLAASAYFLWRERNLRLFQKKKMTVDQLLVRIICDTIRLKLITFRFKKMSTGSRLLLDQWRVPSYCIVHNGSAGRQTHLGIDCSYCGAAG